MGVPAVGRDPFGIRERAPWWKTSAGSTTGFCPAPTAILAVSPWCDMEMSRETMEGTADTDAMVSKGQLGLSAPLLP